MPAAVAAARSMLSTPIPYRQAAMHFVAARSTAPVTFAKQKRMTSASAASRARVSSEASGAAWGSMPAARSTSLSVSMSGHT